MVGLAFLDVDTMAEITKYLEGGTVLLLWLSGDLNLQERMCFGGVRDLHFEDDSSQSTSRWPMVIGDLQGLRKLTINCGIVSLGSHALIWRELSRLKGLLTLNLALSGSLDILKCGVVNGVLELVQIFPLLSRLNLGHLHTNALPDWLHLPHKLEGLSFVFFQTLNPNQWSSAHDWSNITILNAVGFPFMIHDHTIPFHRLFPRLLSYRTAVSDLTESWLSELPSSLTSLNLSATSIPPLQTTFGAILPTSLTHLELNIFSGPDNIIWNFSEARQLSYLKLTTGLNLEALILPDNLANLTLEASLSPSTKLYLPPNLTTFESIHESHIPPPNIFVWQPSDGINPKTQLPNQATPCSLPRGLKKLQITGPNHSEWHSLWLSLPRLSQLETIHWKCSTPDEPEEEQIHSVLEALNPNLLEINICHAFRLSKISRFPKLVSLSSNIGSESISYLSQLPKHLTSLQLHILNSNLEIDFSSLPPHLTELKIRMLHDRWTLRRDDLRATAKFRGLRALKLQCDLDTNIVSSDFGYLPDTLRSLKINTSTRLLTSDVFRFLPRQLRSLGMQTFGNSFEIDFQHLPKGLRKMRPSSDYTGPTTLISYRSNDQDTEVIIPDPRTAKWGFLCQLPRERP